MKLSLIQFDIAWEDPQKNAAKLETLLSESNDGPGDLLVLPEMWPCGFTMNPEAHVFGDPGLSAMIDLAQRHRCHVIGGIPAEVEDGQQNKAVWIDADGTIRGRYVKIKTFTFAGEDRFFIAGVVPVLWQLDGLTVSPFICYDLRFPELARRVMPQAQALIYMASWPAPRIHHWRRLLQARAIENQCYVIGVNRIGRDGNGWDYCGGSMVIDPMGDLILDASDREGVFSVGLDPELVRTTRKTFPFLADMD